MILQCQCGFSADVDPPPTDPKRGEVPAFVCPTCHRKSFLKDDAWVSFNRKSRRTFASRASK